MGTTITTKTALGQNLNHIGPDFFERLWEESWTYIRTIVGVIREPVLVLDRDFRVLTANEPFYQVFHVKPHDTEQKIIYELGNSQWNIPELRQLLNEILPHHVFFKGFEVAHDFPIIGHKVIILNARQIHFKNDTASELFPPIILLAMEDITEMMDVADMLARHTTKFESEMAARTEKLETHIETLQREINQLRKK